MKTLLRAAASAFVAGAMVAVTTGMAPVPSALDPNPDLETISAVSPDFQEDLLSPDQVSVNEEAMSTVSAGTEVTVPFDPAENVVVSGEQPLAITIPDGPESIGVHDGEVLDSSAVAFDSGNFATIVAPLDFGAVEFLSVLANEDAPQEYRYSLEAEGGVSMRLQPDGSVAMSSANGAPAGGIQAPWARDANGTQVPTWYEIDGDDLIQHVAHSDGVFVYPIVADPTLTWQGWGYSIKYTRAETKQVAQTSGDAAALAVLCGLIASAPGAVACGLGGLILTNIQKNYILGIYNRGHCLQQNVTLGWGSYQYEVTC